MKIFLRMLRGLVVPAWAPYALAVAIALGTYWWIDRSAREQERVAVTAEHTLAAKSREDAAEKHFAERASTIAASYSALALAHAADVSRRSGVDEALAASWTAGTKVATGAKDFGIAECWPIRVVKELRRK